MTTRTFIAQTNVMANAAFAAAFYGLPTSNWNTLVVDGWAFLDAEIYRVDGKVELTCSFHRGGEEIRITHTAIAPVSVPSVNARPSQVETFTVGEK